MKDSMKTVLITGAGSGIGKSLALAFSQAGYCVLVGDLNGEAAQAVANQIVEEGGQGITYAFDVSEPDQVQAAFKKCYETFGQIDCVISNAGIQLIGPIDQFDYSLWKKMIDIHLNGAFLCTQAALQYMYPQKSGTILYIGSIHSKIASLAKAPYITAKHGLLGLCRSVAKEGAPYKVRANVICPGFVRTPLVDKQIPEQAKTLGISEEEVIKKVMLGATVDGEFTTLEEISNTALFLANYPNLGLTGQALMLTHGWMME